MKDTSYDALNEAINRVYTRSGVDADLDDDIAIVMKDGRHYTWDDLDQLNEHGNIIGGKFKGDLSKLQFRIIEDSLEPVIDDIYRAMFNRLRGNVSQFQQNSFVDKQRDQEGGGARYYFIAPRGSLISPGERNRIKRRRKGDAEEETQEDDNKNPDERVLTEWPLNTGVTWKYKDTINDLFTRLDKEFIQEGVRIRQIGNPPPAGISHTRIRSDWSTTTDTTTFYLDFGRHFLDATNSYKHVLWGVFEDTEDFEGEGWFRIGTIKLRALRTADNHIHLLWGKRGGSGLIKPLDVQY